MKLKTAGILLFSILHISGCRDDAQAGNNQEDLAYPCAGFGPAEASVYVRDSLNTDVLIDDATVRVFSSDGEQSLIEEAVFIADEDNNANTLTGSYYSPLSLNSNSFEIGLVVFAEGYHAFVTKGIDFELDTRCGGSNMVIYDVYLCPLGTSCL